MLTNVWRIISGIAIVAIAFVFLGNAFDPEIAFFPDYFPTDPKDYCRKHFQHTIGGSELRSSEVIGTITVPYTSGPLTGALICNLGGGQGIEAWLNDKEKLISLMEGAEYSAVDCDMTEPGAGYGYFYDGQLLVDLWTFGGCYKILKDLSNIGPGNCNQSGDCDASWYIQIQDVLIQGIFYEKALLIWMLEDVDDWVAPDALLSNFGIVPPLSTDTNNKGIDHLIILAKDIGPVLRGEFDDGSGLLIDLWELVSVSCHEPYYDAFDVPATMITQAWGGNNKGDVVGLYKTNPPTPSKGFIRRMGVITTIDYPGAVWTAAYDINNLGDIVGRYWEGAGFPEHAFLLRNDKFTTIDYPGAVLTRPESINDRGDIVGYYRDIPGPFGTFHGFLFRKGEFTTIDFPVGATQTFIRGISDSGRIVGHYRDMSGTTHGFLLEKGEFTPIDFPGGIETFPRGINASSQVVGNFRDSDGFLRGFFWEKGEFMTIGHPCGFPNFLRDINNRGNIIGFFNSPGGTYGFSIKK